jgi:chemosensory pili system protein ChpA (sensor histidine kinase/response regulator)
VGGVRASFHLDEVLVASERVEELSETLSAPSVRLMKTVAAAIREDLTRVKDVLDIFVRKGASQVDDLVPQLEMLRKIADTLGCSGWGCCAAACRARSRRCRASSIADCHRTMRRCCPSPPR